MVGWAFDQKTGSPTSKLLLVKLADNANDQGYCYPSLKKICAESELSERATREHLMLLQKAGLIEIIRRFGDGGVHLPSHFQLNAQTRPAASGMHVVQEGAARGAVPVVRHVQNNKEPSEENPQENLHNHAPKGAVTRPALRGKPRTLIGEFSPAEDLQARAVAYWLKHGRRDLNVEDEVFRFRGFHTGKGSRMVDWGAAWQTWYCNALQMNRLPPGAAPQGGLANGGRPDDRASLFDWEERLRMFYGYMSEDSEYPQPKGSWDKRWGPIPHAAGCRVPPEAYAKIRPMGGLT